MWTPHIEDETSHRKKVNPSSLQQPLLPDPQEQVGVFAVSLSHRDEESRMITAAVLARLPVWNTRDSF